MSEEKEEKEIRRPLVRVGITAGDSHAHSFLKKAGSVEGVKPYDWFMDEDARLWLIYVGRDEDALGRLHDVLVKRGGLSLKSHGEWVGRDGRDLDWS